MVSTNAFQELWVASDGTPSITKDSGYCELGVVSREDGVICKMISYNLNQTSNLTASLRIRMYADSGLLGFTPAAATIKYSGDGQTGLTLARRRFIIMFLVIVVSMSMFSVENIPEKYGGSWRQYHQQPTIYICFYK